MISASEPRRILLVRPSALGDVARTVPALVSLRRAFPEAKIDWLVHESFLDAVAHHPDLSEAIPFPRDRFGRCLRDPRIAAELFRYLRDLRRRGDDRVKLLDFGVAKSLTPTEEEQLRITQEGKFVGTPRYAAPELIQGEELTERTDIYSTGLLMWEALTGEPAVSSVVFQKCCAQHLSDDPWRLPEDIDCPTPLADVVHRALRKDPEERFDSCRALAEALEER